ncbi:TAXI family TRAP transporter solute-binding subunit [Fischerella thermalis]|uniref:TAXI family TRAP transporter solute-binding subunit n=1 Tax=Fischerella thermalis TaxID=372787 RepID=UPI0002DF2757|nr:TAXI family TRAP transporter solute-binding subunit [Fischerella thermalis]
MATSKNPNHLGLISFLEKLDPQSKLVFLSLGFASVGLVLFIIWNIIVRLTTPQLTLAAGDPEGESYIISEAIQKVVEKNSNINIKLVATGGTTQNLEMLQEGKADLVTAQADVIGQEMDLIESRQPHSATSQIKSSPRAVAVLYQDMFQLVVRDPNIKKFEQLRGKTIALPAKGGQYKSFLKIAEHYGLVKKDKPDVVILGSRSNYYDDRQAEEDFKSKRADALFRVRALGNLGIAKLVQDQDGRLLPIAQAQAMKIKYPAFESAKIPQGAYRGNPPMPLAELDTVAVDRLLVASENIDNNVIREITRIIFENRQEIADAIAENHVEVKPLIASIRRPRDNDGTGIFIHPGAIAFYERDKPSFVQENADFLALILTIFLLVISWLRQLKLWVERSKKDKADDYINTAIKLMDKGIGKLEDRQKQLDNIFKNAAQALIAERISQESFRTFNEAYKTTREAIEREKEISYQEIEQKQREISAEYIKAVVALLQDKTISKDLLQKELDQILEKVASDLIAENISQESYRTFVEAYKITRDAIERK